MLKVGVIGCGAIAQRRHLPEYANRNDVEIIAVCDFNLQRAEQVAKQFGAVLCWCGNRGCLEASTGLIGGAFMTIDQLIIQATNDKVDRFL